MCLDNNARTVCGIPIVSYLSGGKTSWHTSNWCPMMQITVWQYMAEHRFTRETCVSKSIQHQATRDGLMRKLNLIQDGTSLHTTFSNRISYLLGKNWERLTSIHAPILEKNANSVDKEKWSWPESVRDAWMEEGWKGDLTAGTNRSVRTAEEIMKGAQKTGAEVGLNMITEAVAEEMDSQEEQRTGRTVTAYTDERERPRTPPPPPPPKLSTAASSTSKFAAFNAGGGFWAPRSGPLGPLSTIGPVSPKTKTLNQQRQQQQHREQRLTISSFGATLQHDWEGNSGLFSPSSMGATLQQYDQGNGGQQSFSLRNRQSTLSSLGATLQHDWQQKNSVSLQSVEVYGDEKEMNKVQQPMFNLRKQQTTISSLGATPEYDQKESSNTGCNNASLFDTPRRNRYSHKQHLVDDLPTPPTTFPIARQRRQQRPLLGLEDWFAPSTPSKSKITMQTVETPTRQQEHKQQEQEPPHSLRTNKLLFPLLSGPSSPHASLGPQKNNNGQVPRTVRKLIAGYTTKLKVLVKDAEWKVYAMRKSQLDAIEGKRNTDAAEPQKTQEEQEKYVREVFARVIDLARLDERVITRALST